MELYKTGSILVDITLGIMVLGVIIRLIMMAVYFRRNGSRTMTDDQKETLKKVGRITAIIVIAVAAAGIITMLRA